MRILRILKEIYTWERILAITMGFVIAGIAEWYMGFPQVWSSIEPHWFVFVTGALLLFPPAYFVAEWLNSIIASLFDRCERNG